MFNTLSITAFYLGLNGLVFTALSIWVVRLRWVHKVNMGDGGENTLRLAIRAFGNNSEYLAVVFLLFAMLEIKGVSHAVLHLSGTIFTVGRITHAIAINNKGGAYNFMFRIGGMIITYTFIILSSLYLVLGAKF